MSRLTQIGVAEKRPGIKLTTFIPIRLKRHGGRKVLIPASGKHYSQPEHDAPILTALSRAFHWQRLIDEGVVSSGNEIARQEGLHKTTVNDLLRMTQLSPTLIRDILAGKQPKTLSILWLKRHTLPPDWDDQHAVFRRMDE